MNDDDPRTAKAPRPLETVAQNLMRQIAALGSEERAQLQHWIGTPTPFGTRGTAQAPDTSNYATEAAGVRLHNIDAAFGMVPLDDRDALVAEALIHAAKTILRNVPDSPDRMAAVSYLRVARWAAHSAISNNGRF